MTVTRLRRFLQAFTKKRPNFQLFCSSGSTHLWKIAYLGAVAFLFGSAAQNRFSLPQDPLVDTDFGRCWPAVKWASSFSMRMAMRGETWIAMAICWPTVVGL